LEAIQSESVPYEAKNLSGWLIESSDPKG